MKSIQIRKDGFFKVSRLRKHRKSRPHAGSRRTRIIDRVPLLRGTLRVQPESRLFSGLFTFFHHILSAPAPAYWGTRCGRHNLKSHQTHPGGRRQKTHGSPRQTPFFQAAPHKARSPRFPTDTDESAGRPNTWKMLSVPAESGIQPALPYLSENFQIFSFKRTPSTT